MIRSLPLHGHTWICNVRSLQIGKLNIYFTKIFNLIVTFMGEIVIIAPDGFRCNHCKNLRIPGYSIRSDQSGLPFPKYFNLKHFFSSTRKYISTFLKAFKNQQNCHFPILYILQSVQFKYRINSDLFNIVFTYL